MKRYIEIVFDDSGSMLDHISARVTKLERAKKLFEKEVLPLIGGEGDHVVLRLLGDRCGAGHSVSQELPVDKDKMKSIIDGIDARKSTPLYYAIRDALTAAQTSEAQSKHIFVLTDGGDTCSEAFEEVIPEDLLRGVQMKDFHKVIVSFCTDYEEARTNHRAVANALDAQYVEAGGKHGVTLKDMSAQFRKATVGAGLRMENVIPPCYPSDTSIYSDWIALEREGLLLHQANELFNYDFIDWNPVEKDMLTMDEYREFRFLHALRFKSLLPVDLIETMLNTLERPLLYSHECIRWDFERARWIEVDNDKHQTDFVEDPHAHLADQTNDKESFDTNLHRVDHDNDPDVNAEVYGERRYYEVVVNTEQFLPTFWLKPYEEDSIDFPKSPQILRPGDIVKFRQ